jgi:lipoprotein-anchoring transpeptidase ErfK/SrfK
MKREFIDIFERSADTMKGRGFKAFIAGVLCAALMAPNYAFADEMAVGAADETRMVAEVLDGQSEFETDEIENLEIEESEIDTAETETVETVTDEANEIEETKVPAAGINSVKQESVDDALSDDGSGESEPEELEWNGLVTDNDGKIYYYVDGEKFTGGYKEVTDENGKTAYYYFGTDGVAYTKGYKQVKIDGVTYHYYFQNNGQAYTDGFLEFIHTNGKTYYFYFQSNGQAYTKGYKGVTSRAYADGEGNLKKLDDTTKYHYYFQNNGQAYTKGFLEFVHTNGKTYYFYFQSNGQAYTKGYKGVTSRAYADGKGNLEKLDDTTKYHYYFQSNGQAYTKGYLKFVHTNGKTYVFYFQKNGQGYTKGYLKYKHTDGKTYVSYLQSNGQAFTGGWKTINGKKYYFNKNGQASTGDQKISGKYYYFNSVGVIQSGWVKENGTWHYYDKSTYERKFKSNTLHTAWQKIQSMSSDTKYFMVVDTDETQTMIFKGSKGNWEPIYNWNCSVGKESTPTVKGTFRVGVKGYSFGSDYTCYYYTQFYGDYLFHSVLYHKNTFDIRNGRLGKHNSHGCIRLDISNAKWIYDNIPRSTKVLVY